MTEVEKPKRMCDLQKTVAKCHIMLSTYCFTTSH